MRGAAASSGDGAGGVRALGGDLVGSGGMLPRCCSGGNDTTASATAINRRLAGCKAVWLYSGAGERCGGLACCHICRVTDSGVGDQAPPYSYCNTPAGGRGGTGQAVFSHAWLSRLVI